MKILIADDDHDIGSLIKEMLSSLEIENKVVLSGSEVVSEMLENPDDYDCIILDLHMEGLNGIQTSEMLKKISIDIPVIMITADGQFESEVKARCAGIDCYIKKPFNFDELSNAINEFARGSCGKKI